MLLKKRGDIPYILGLIFFIAGVVYFFASNWALLDRPVKIGLSLSILLISYGASALYKRSSWFAYLGNWWLFIAAIAFGVSVALIGQLYNSHADSYLLFLIWLIPTAALAWFTKYQPFYWLSFLLFELTVWMKLYPTGVWVQYNEWEELAIYLGLIVLHIGLYLFWNRINLEKIAFISLGIIQYCAIFLLIKHSIYDILESFASSSFVFLVLHGIYIAFIVKFWRKFINERKKHPLEMAIHLLFSGSYIIYNTFYIYIMVFGEFIFYTGFLLLIGLFVFSIYVLQKLAKIAKDTDKKWTRYTLKFFVGVMSFLGTLIAIGSLSSFVVMMFGFGNALEIGYLVLGIICIAVGLKINNEAYLVIQITLQITGIAFLFLFSFMQPAIWDTWLITIVLVALTLYLFKKTQALLYYLAANFGLINALMSLVMKYELPNESLKMMLLLLGVINAAIFLKFKRVPFGLGAYLLSVGYLFALTMDVTNSPVGLTIFYHVLFIAYLYWHLTHPAHSSRLYLWPTWIAFAGFLIWKYYEYIWTLLHKSLAFFIVSALFFLIFYAWGRKHTENARTRPAWSWKPVLVILLLQLVFVGGTAWQKEQLLQNGELVALKLEPLDPRSMLQGDYVQLNYSIHTLYRDREAQNENRPGSVQVQLRKTADTLSYSNKAVPIYETTKFIKGNTAPIVEDDTVTIQGKGRFGTLTLGIEHFFIPENTGREWEDKNYALVRVAKNGDAILETLVKK
ncbi:putative membrane-anchored protein/putative membrane protein [Bacillus ectoiniformans]|uniref:GDYXXLXY domain-containing protein n=1 Tax=Bacillus ectoiniformans TaxID=1494429 RepID=UPI001956F480|nr:GDYXXLXY domain-containing protein [Bacillus ectoiniformans]MBM7649582.1 putative membrane-anchored protein/putative membrane protein [Bacillus ectoiniformans]